MPKAPKKSWKKIESASGRSKNYVRTPSNDSKDDKSGTEVIDTVFVGNLSLFTEESKLKEYFEKFGAISSLKICLHPENKKSKRYGFITFEDPAVIPTVLGYKSHFLDGKTLQTKHAARNSSKKLTDSNNNNSNSAINNQRVSLPSIKLFIGGVSQSTSTEDLVSYFSRFGEVSAAVLLPDRETGRHRGFGFLTFKDPTIGEVVSSCKYHIVNNKQVEIKVASPKAQKSTVLQSDNINLLNALQAQSLANMTNNSFSNNMRSHTGGNSILGDHPWEALAANQAVAAATTNMFRIPWNLASQQLLYNTHFLGPQTQFLTASPQLLASTNAYRLVHPYSVPSMEPHHPPVFMTPNPTASNPQTHIYYNNLLQKNYSE